MPESERGFLKPPRSELIPLSNGQQRLWFLDQFHGGATSEYNFVGALRFHGPLNVECLARSVRRIGERHEILRTSFPTTDGRPAQVIDYAGQVSVSFENYCEVTSPAQDPALQQVVRTACQEESRRPFNLARGPLIRFRLLRLAGDLHVLLHTAHHIVWDDWSRGIFHRELSTLYSAFLNGQPDSSPPLPAQYADFAIQEPARHEIDGRQLEYWKTTLSGAPEELGLTIDRARPAGLVADARTCHTVLPAEQFKRLRDLARANGCTLYMVLLAALAVLLYRYTGQDDVIVASPVSTRTSRQLEDLIGFFVNPVVMRIRARPTMSFRDILAHARTVVLDALDHQSVPFEQVVQVSGQQRSSTRQPLMEVMFSMVAAPWIPPQLPRLRVEVMFFDEVSLYCDLMIQAREVEATLSLLWLYRTALFDDWRIGQMAKHHLRLLEAVMEDPGRSIGLLAMLSEDERFDILGAFGTSQLLGNSSRHVHKQFEAQAEKTPQAIAVRYSQNLGYSGLTYADLNKRVNQLARYLRALHVNVEDVIAVVVPRSLETVIALLATLKVGAVWLPLDPDSPPARLARILEEAKPARILSHSLLAPSFAGFGACVILDDPEVSSAIGRMPSGNLTARERARDIMPTDAAYIIYTSGSTGAPKGVVVEHRALSLFFQSMLQVMDFAPGDRHVAVTATTFDISLLELLLPLCRGAEVIIAAMDDVQSPRRLSALIKDNRATSLQATPSYLSALVEEDCLKNIRILCGGEPLPPDLAGTFLRSTSQVWNLYGPTEATIWASARQVTTADCENGVAGCVNIGRPLPGYVFYVLDRSHLPVPVGVNGELYIGGEGVARGYLNRPDLTEERFLPDPFSPGGRMYRTGDIVRWRADKNLDFLGRSDGQVKIRGNRVELGEIEAVLRSHPLVKEAAVVPSKDEPGHVRLAAYVVTKGDSKLAPEELTRFAGQSLPTYMVPASITILASLPLTPHGKLDRNALPTPEFSPSATPRKAVSPVERSLCEAFAEVTGAPDVGLDDDFFALGGDSLAGMRLIHRVYAKLQVELPLNLIYDEGTPGRMAAWIESQKSSFAQAGE